MRRTIIAIILALGLLLIPSTASAAGVTVVKMVGDGVWTEDNTWLVEMSPGETKSTILILHNSSSSPLDVEVSVTPDSYDNGNLVFGLDKLSFEMAGKSYTDATLTVEASGSATPGTYTTELKIKSEIPPITGGGGGGSGGFIGALPIFSNVLTSGITETSVDVCWWTDQYSSSQVEYWSSPSILTELNRFLVREHLVHLLDLTPGTTYYFKVMSKGYATAVAVSEVYSFTTLGGEPIVEPLPPEPEKPEPVVPETDEPEPIEPIEPEPALPEPEWETPWGLVAGIVVGVALVVWGTVYWIKRRRAS